ncbi:MAG: hypothetical protein AAF696_20950 [Bacteroidota bacterium]
MIPSKALLLIDGLFNFHTLRLLQIDEKQVPWSKIFNSLPLLGQGQTWEAIWFRPNRVEEIHISGNYFSKWDTFQILIRKKYVQISDKLESQFKHGNLPVFFQEEIEITQWYLNSWLQQVRRFKNQEEMFFDKLARKYRNIRISRPGILQVDAYQRKVLIERKTTNAISVQIGQAAFDPAYDKIILFGEVKGLYKAIRIAKDQGKVIFGVGYSKGECWGIPTWYSSHSEIMDMNYQLNLSSFVT